jgi:hypothetical protein
LLLNEALIEASKNRKDASRKYLNCRKLPFPAKARNRKKSANPSPPAAANFVALTGSVTESRTTKRQTNGVPTKINREAIFSAALLNMG